MCVFSTENQPYLAFSDVIKIIKLGWPWW